MNYLFVDTETTGFPPKGRLVRLMAIVTNEAGKDLLTMDLIVQPDGFGIPEKTTAIHGITTEQAWEEGVDLFDALTLFSEFLKFSEIMVAHNVIDFDRRIINFEFRGLDHQGYYNLHHMKTFCTMKNKAIIRYCGLKDKNGKPKQPKLSELHYHVFGRELEGAHGWGDVEGLKDCFFELKKLWVINA